MQHIVAPDMEAGRSYAQATMMHKERPQSKEKNHREIEEKHTSKEGHRPHEEEEEHLSEEREHQEENEKYQNEVSVSIRRTQHEEEEAHE